MKIRVGITIGLVLLQTGLLRSQTPGQPPVEACKPGNFTIIGFPNEFGAKRDESFRVKIDERFDGNFLTKQKVWVPVILQGVQKWNGLAGSNLSLHVDGLTSEDPSGFDGDLTIAACGGGMFPCPVGPPPEIPPGPEPPAFAEGIIAVTLVSSTGGVDRAISDSDIFFNPEIPVSTSPGGNQVDFESVLLHELGHAVGLGHNDNCVVGPTVMESVIELGEVRRDLSSAETEGAKFLYPDSSISAIRLFDSDRSLRFDAASGGASPFGEVISIYGKGGGRWQRTVSTTSGGSWLQVTPMTGRFPIEGNVLVGVNSTNLAPGDYSGAISFSLDGHGGPPATVSVALHVGAALPLEQQPLLTKAGVVSALNQDSQALAPGGLFTLWGNFLSVTTAEAASIPLPTKLGGTEVLVNGVLAPLLYVSPGQVNGQIPADAVTGHGGIIVRTGLGQTPSIPVDLAPAAPAIPLLEGDQVLVLNADSTVNSPENPASAGSFVSVFLTGQGAVSPPVASGWAAPASPLSRVVAASSAKLGGQDANLQFLGLAPGFVGVAQANVEVPAGLSGQLKLEITIGGVTSNTGFISVE